MIWVTVGGKSFPQALGDLTPDRTLSPYCGLCVFSGWGWNPGCPVLHEHGAPISPYLDSFSWSLVGVVTSSTSWC